MFLIFFLIWARKLELPISSIKLLSIIRIWSPIQILLPKLLMELLKLVLNLTRKILFMRKIKTIDNLWLSSTIKRVKFSLHLEAYFFWIMRVLELIKSYFWTDSKIIGLNVWFTKTKSSLSINVIIFLWLLMKAMLLASLNFSQSLWKAKTL